MDSKDSFITKEEDEKFSPSLCECETCDQMHASVKEWKKFKSTTALQRGMKKIVAKIENDIDLRRSSRLAKKFIQQE